jgi:glycosyltransferase involved in cell wall biosynthesis
MRLGIISDAHHYYNSQKELCTLTPLSKQFEQWASMFESVLICAPLIDKDMPSTCTPYSVRNIQLLPIPLAGGNTAAAKLDLLCKLPVWWTKINLLLKSVDAIHVRCPNNISILGLLALCNTRHLRQAVFTGSWNGYSDLPEPITYRWQRWFLKRYFDGPVAVYGNWPNQPDHVVSSFSPSYGDEIWVSETLQVQERIDRLQNIDVLEDPVTLISVGSLTRGKNQQLILRAIKILNEMGVKSQIYFLGDGVMRDSLIKLVSDLGIESQVCFNGFTSQEEVRNFYRKADFVIQAPLIEGYGKVPIEAFFHGAIPIISDVNLSSQIVDGSKRGRCFPLGDPYVIALHIVELIHSPKEMITLISNGRSYARDCTLEVWRKHIKNMLEEHWNISLETNLEV